MAELLAIIGLPTVLDIASSALTLAWDQYNGVEERKAQCEVILSRCRDLLNEVAKQHKKGRLNNSMKGNLRFIESACLSAKNAITYISGKGFAWRLLHQDTISQYISDAENAVSTAWTKFSLGAQLDAQRLQSEFLAARERDHSDLLQNFQNLAQNDQKILEALQNDGQERRQLQELLVALTKHVQKLGPVISKHQGPANEFARTASMALQRLSSQTGPIDVPDWSVTSLEVTFNRNDKGSCIGRGGFGRIYKGEWYGKIVAVKEMHRQDAQSLNKDDLKSIRHEISIWSQLRHPHVLPFYCACMEASQPFMVTQLCLRGNALEFLRASPHANRINMLYEIALGMNYLHIKSIIHADLKASNILIGDDEKALIADFGLSHVQGQVCSRRGTGRSNTGPPRGGSLRWMAPERLDGKPPKTPVDVYSFALTAWELYTGEVPFSRVLDSAMIVKVVDKKERPPRPGLMKNNTLWNLVKQSWHGDPLERPGFATLHVRLGSLLIQSNLATNPGPPAAPKKLSPSAHGTGARLSPLRGMLTGNATKVSPAPPVVALPSVDSMSIHEPVQDRGNPTEHALQLYAYLSAPGFIGDKMSTLSALELFTQSAEGRAAVVAIPDLLTQFQTILVSDTSDAKEMTLTCMANIAGDDVGKQAILNHPNILPTILHLLEHGSSVSKGRAANCLGKISVLEMPRDQRTRLLHRNTMKALRDIALLQNSPNEQAQTAACLVRLTCNTQGQEALLDEPGLPRALVKLLSHSTPDVRQNAARCIANVATTNVGQTTLIALPDIIGTLGDLLKPEFSSFEAEQAMRCLHYLTNTEVGQNTVVANSNIMSQLPHLLAHESRSVQKHTAGCCRHLCYSGVDRVFAQNGLPEAMGELMDSSEVKEYAMDYFFWIIHHCMDPNTNVDSLPVQHNRQAFLLGLEKLLSLSASQAKAAECLKRLCNGKEPLHSAPWVSDIAHRRSLLIALANPSLKAPDAMKEAAHCLALVASHADDQAKEIIISNDLLSNFATLLSTRPEAQLHIIRSIRALATCKSARGQKTLNHAQLMSALHQLCNDSSVLKDVKVEAEACLRNLRRGKPPRKPQRKQSGPHIVGGLYVAA